MQLQNEQALDQWSAVKKNFAQSISKMFPITGKKNILEIGEVTYDESKTNLGDLRSQEQAKHSEKTWGVPVYAEFVLKDKLTGQVINKTKQKIADMPKLTQRETYIVGGGEYNSAYQWRLKSGIYSKIKENGQYETEFNLNGAGKDFAREQRLKIPFDPETKQFKLKYATVAIPLYSMLKADDVPDEKIKEVLGEDIYKANFRKNWQADIVKLYNAKLKKRGVTAATDSFDDIKKAIQKELHKAEVLPETTKLTLGKEYKELSGDVLLHGADHIRQVTRGKKPDDVYSLYFKHLLGLDDFIAEKFGESKTALKIKSKIRNNLDRKDSVSQIVGKDLFTKPLGQVFYGNALSQRPDQTNPLDMMSAANLTTIKGPGGISSEHAIRNSMKIVNQSHLGYLDSLLTPECFSKSTFILCFEGWKPVTEVSINDNIACNINGKLEFHKPTKLHEYDYSGQMYGVNGKRAKYLVTPNHRVFHKSIGGNLWKIKNAEDTYGLEFTLSASHKPFEGSPMEYFELSKIPVVKNAPPTQVVDKVDINLWAEFMGWFLSEGSFDKFKMSAVHITQVRSANPSKVERITSLLEKLPWKFHYYGDKEFVINNKQLCAYVAQFGFCNDKYIPEYFFSAPIKARSLLLETLMLGDGRTCLQKGKYEQEIYTTTSERLARDVERLMISLGHAVSVRKYEDKRQERYLDVYEIRKLRRPNLNVYKDMQYKENYEGKVYCVTVPGGLVYVKKDDGIGFWSGNSTETGISLHLPLGVKKVGREARALVFNIQDQKYEYVNPAQLHGELTVLPDQIKIKDGKPVPRKEVVTVIDPKTHEFIDKPYKEAKYVLPSPRNLFSEATNLIPFLQCNQGNRTMTGSRQPSQGVPLANREQPLVQVQSNGSSSYETLYGKKFSHQSPVDGKVVDISKDELGHANAIHIKGNDNKNYQIQVYNHFPLNDKKSFLHAEPVIKIGDEVKKGQTLADSNFTKSGVLSIGTNLRTAYVNYGSFSVSGDSMVYWVDEKNIGHYTPIEEIPPRKGIKSNVLNTDSVTPQLHNVHSFIGHYTEDPMMCVTTRRGIKVKATKSHSFITVNEEGDFVEIKPTEMIPGKTLVPIIQPVINWSQTMPELFLESFNKTGKSLTIKLDRDTGFFIGMFIAEGCVTYHNNLPHSVGIAVTEQELIKKLSEILDKWGLYYKHTIYKKHNGISGIMNISSSALTHFLHENCGRYAYGKRIPDILWSAPKEFAEGFIDGYWSGDGTCTKEVTASTASKRLAEGLCFLLNSFGAKSHYRQYKTRKLDAYLIRVDRETLKKLPAFSLTRKQDKKTLLIKEETICSHDLIPIPKNFKSLIISALEKRSIRNDADYCSRKTLQSIYEELPEKLKKLVDAPVWWDVVSELEEIEKEDYVYDLDMRPYGNFVVGSGLVVHNTFEDSVVISEEASKKLASEHLHKISIDIDPTSDKVSLNKFLTHISSIGKKIKKDKLESLGEEGVIKPGTKVKPGDILVAAVTKNELDESVSMMSSRLKGAVAPYKDKSLVWEHDYEGEVKKVIPKSGGKGYTVYVKTVEPAQVGDKVCYDEETEILTKTGWKFVKDLELDDYVATLNPINDELEYHQPNQLHKYVTGGNMYKIKSQQVDLLVTQDHNMYVKKRGRKNYELVSAKSIYGKRVQYKKNAVWKGSSPKEIIFNALKVKAGQSGRGTRMLPEIKMSVEAYMTLLGAFLSEGNILNQPNKGNFGIEITQTKQPNRSLFIEELKRLRIKHLYSGDKIRIISKQLMEHFIQFGKSYQKYIPEFVFDFAKEDLEILFKWLMWGDGTSKNGMPIAYTTTSKKLADDVQRLCLHIGKAGNVILSKLAEEQTIKGKIYWCRDRYDVRIVNTKLSPEVNHGHIKSQLIQEEKLLTNYVKPVYCLTVKNHIVYVRRNGKSVFSGNCGRSGDKNIIGAVLPNHEMPYVKNADGTKSPIDLITAPSGVVSRINIGQLLELGASKIAQKTGKPYVTNNFGGEKVDYAEKIRTEMKEHGIADTDVIHDPVLGKDLDNKVLTGYKYIMKLKHQVEKKESVRGLDQAQAGKYSINLDPQRGKGQGAQAIAQLDLYALLAHGARQNLREMSSYKAELQHDPTNMAHTDADFWNRVMLGLPLPPPKPTFAYRKFEGYLTGLGLNLKKTGNETILTPLTDKGVLALSNGEVKDAQQVRGKDSKEIPGGLFDKIITGGIPNQVGKGLKWSHHTLAEPMPSPIFTGSQKLPGPAVVLSGLKHTEFEKVVKGEKTVTVNGKEMTGGTAIYNLLKNVDVKKELKNSIDKLPTLSGAELNKENKKAKFLQALDKLNLRPEEAYMMNHVPIIPPIFRPMVQTPNGDVSQADITELYKHLIINNVRLKDPDMKKLPGQEEQLRAAVWDNLKAVTGLGKVPTYDGNRKYKGLLQQIAGDSPKTGFFQHKVMKKRQELSMRSTVIPGPDMGIDEVGLPKNSAMELYKPFVVRELVRAGKDLIEAKKEVKEGTSMAWKALEKAIQDRPVLVKRDPVLHKYNIQAFKPTLVEGKAISMHPLNCAAANLDFDGNCCKGDSEIYIKIWYPTSTNVKTFIEDEYQMKFTNTTQIIIEAKDHAILKMNIEDVPRLENTKVKDKNGAWVYEVPKGLHVWSYNHEKGQPTFEEFTHLTVEDNCPTTKVDTRRFSVTCSRNESLCVYNHETEVIEKIAPKDAIGKLAPIMSEIPHQGKGGTFELGWLVGAFISDGSFSGSRTNYAKKSLEHRNRFFTYLQQLQKQPITRHTYAEIHDGTYGISGESIKDMYSNIVEETYAILRECYEDVIIEGRSALKKRIPPQIFALSKETLLGLFTGLLDGDGSVSISRGKKKPQAIVNFSTSSPYLRDSVEMLCRILGIRTAVSKVEPKKGRLQKVTNYVVSFSTVDILKYISELKVIDEKYKEAFELLASQERRDILDIVPVPNFIMDLVTKKSGPMYEHPSYESLATVKNRCKPNYYVSRTLAKEILSVLEKQSVLAIDKWKTLVSSTNVHWDVIEKLEETKAETVYDLIIPTTKVFIVNSGLCIWDTMAVYLPLTEPARQEALDKMLPSKNLFSSTNYGIMHAPDHESIIGLNMLSKWGSPSGAKFSSLEELKKSNLPLHEVVKVKFGNSEKETTKGRALLAEYVPEQFKEKLLHDSSLNLKKSSIHGLLEEYARHSPKDYTRLVDDWRRKGAHTAHSAGFSFSLNDLKPLKEKRDAILQPYHEEAAKIRAGNDSPEEQYKKIIDLYNDATIKLDKELSKDFAAQGNNMFKMVDTKARGSMAQFRQTVIAPMLMVDSTNKVVATPVTKSYSEGLSVAQYWTTLHGARKGTLQRAQGTAVPGAMAKEIVNLNVTTPIVKDDCGTTNSVHINLIDKNGNNEKDLIGRYLSVDVKTPTKTFSKGTLVTPEMFSHFKEHNHSSLPVRSPLTCTLPQGICAKCFGRNENDRDHEIGANIGAIASHALSEPVVQLAMDCVSGSSKITILDKTCVKEITIEDLWNGN